MARDYKNSSRTRSAAKPRSKPKSRSKQSTPAPIWFLAGLALGLGAALAVHAYHVQLAPRLLTPITVAAEPATDAKAPASDNRPRFEFYKILPEMEVVVPEEEERALTAKPKPPTSAAPPASSKPAPSKERYLLQVASFQQHGEADRLKAQLALIGLQATIQTVEIHGGQTWHRVRVGPFSDRDEIASVRQRLQANGIEAVLLKLSG